MIEQTLQDKVAVVTGSSGGIGRAIAIELSRAGANVVVHGFQNPERADETVRLIKQQRVEAIAKNCDISVPDNCLRLVEESWKWQDGVDIWVNNAGADVLTGDNAGLSFDEKLKRLWQVDVQGTINLSRAVGAKMASAGGVIINLGWDQADFGMSGDSGEMFAAAKGAVMSFSRSLARSLAPSTRVNCVAPGWIKTAWGDTASTYWQERATKESLLGRWGSAEDVANAVRFLCSPDASFMTGQVIRVNGGYRGEFLS